MHNFVASGIRGGLAYIAKRHAVANDPRLEDYDSSAPPVVLTYFDANGLYSYAMTQPLPYSNFSWLSRDEIQELDIDKLSVDGEWGYILEVDLDYPHELHDDHSDYPLAPEKRPVQEVSEYTRSIAAELGHVIKPTVKLMSTLYDKRKYVVHYVNLQLYLRRGLVLRRIRRVLKFRQRAWLKPYIETNTRMRQEATNPFEKDLRKLMNNCIFGKAIENKQKRMSVKIVRDAKRAVVNNSWPHADTYQKLGNDLISLRLRARRVDCDLPTYTGFTILELSKVLMYDFHYGVFKDRLGKGAELLFTDTDSLSYSLGMKSDDLEEFMKDVGRFDTSNYPIDNPLYDGSHKQELGYFKDELGGESMLEFVGLRPKMYSYKTPSASKQTAKGISRTYVKHHVSHEDYVSCLMDHEVKKGTWSTIRSRKHQITTDKVTKSLLSPYDDKRWIANDGVTTYAHGHYRYTQLEKQPDDFDPDIDMYAEAEKDKDVERLIKVRRRIGREEEEKRMKEEAKRTRRMNARAKKSKQRFKMTTKEKEEKKQADRDRKKTEKVRAVDRARKKTEKMRAVDRARKKTEKMRAVDRARKKTEKMRAADRARKRVESGNKTPEQKKIAKEERRARYREKKAARNFSKGD
jgi:hypothetical protein